MTKTLPLLAACIVALAAPQLSAAPLPEVDMAALMAQYKRPTAIPFPADNPYNDAKYELGKDLFFDPRLSESAVTSCATCHNPSFDWGDGLSKGVGFEHKMLSRNSPTILNLAWDPLFFWDGRAKSLEQQALSPIGAHDEMNMPMDTLITHVKMIAYEPLFEKAFPGEPDPVNKDNIAKAIATFERKVVSNDAPFDTWIAGDSNAISAEAKRGFVLFNQKANCASCHSGWKFGDGSFHDIGVADEDLGRGKILPFPSMQHAFKTVGLRNIDRRAPYMHDGSLPTLESVIDHYDHGFTKRPSLDASIKPLHLTAEEKADLIAFLHTITSDDTPVTLPELPR